MKKTCFTVFFAFLIAGVSLFSLEQTDTAKKQAIIQKFDPDLCQNGYAGSWTGACICFDGYHGKYCEKKKNLALLREREREREK
jgi:putative lipase involved disintegration of autophagic bodies